MNKLIAIVGMTGSGKTTVADYLMKKGFLFLRMGQITLDEVKRKGLTPSEENERPIREQFRKDYGMAAFAVLNCPKIDELLKKGPVVVDGLYSWSEYKEFEKRYGDDFVCIAIIASPKTRYARLEKRKLSVGDEDMRMREATSEQARNRDFAEIENIEKGGPIAMAQYYIVNETGNEDVFSAVDAILRSV
ncbi:MAG: AAA family ATPase [Nanoarchaeota archaeon]